MDKSQQLKSYKMLIDIAKKTTSAMDSDEILNAILEGLISVLDHVEVGILYLYDESLNLLKLECSHNIEFESTYPFLIIGEGVSGKTFLNDQSVILNGVDVFASFIDKPSTYMNSFENTNHQYPYSSMSCLLKIGSRKLGVVTIYNYHEPTYHFNADDLELLQVAADHAAIVIKQSRLIKQKNTSLKQLEKNNHMLNKTIHLQNEFNTIMLEGKGYSEILKCLDQNLGIEVHFSDGFFQQISCSRKDSALNIPKTFINKGILKAYTTKKNRTIKYEHSGTNWIFVPVIGKGKLLGFLVCSIHGRRFNREEESNLNYAAIVMAMEWLRKETDFKSLLGFINQFFDKVLQGKMDEKLLDWANKLGFNKSDHFKVIMVRKDFILDSDIYDIEALKTFYLDKLKISLDSIGLSGIIFFRGELLCVVINSVKASHLKETKIDRFVNDILGFDESSCIAKSGIHKSIENLRIAYTEAEECHQMMKISHLDVRVMGYDYLGIWQLLLKLDKDDLMAFASRYLGPLVSNPNTKQKDLQETLKSYVYHNRNIKQVAEDVNLHPNTVYFRIKKIEDMLNIDLDDNYTYMNVQISCAIINHLNE